MTTTTVTPGTYTVKVGADKATATDYSTDVANVTEATSPVTVTVPASFAAAGYDDVGSVTAALTLTVLVDLDDPANLYYWLQTHNLEAGVVVVSKGATAPSYEYPVRFVRPGLPMVAGSQVQVDVTLPVLGAATITPPAGP